MQDNSQHPSSFFKSAEEFRKQNDEKEVKSPDMSVIIKKEIENSNNNEINNNNNNVNQANNIVNQNQNIINEQNNLNNNNNIIIENNNIGVDNNRDIEQIENVSNHSFKSKFILLI